MLDFSKAIDLAESSIMLDFSKAIDLAESSYHAGLF